MSENINSYADEIVLSIFSELELYRRVEQTCLAFVDHISYVMMGPIIILFDFVRYLGWLSWIKQVVT